jgi:DNA mismatch repair ATPase MutS
MLLAATLGKGNKGGDYVLLEPPTGGSVGWAGWMARLVERFSRRRPDASGFTIDASDETGVKALASLRNHGLALIAGALGESVEHVRNFLAALGTELAFYVGCINLHERLGGARLPTCVPVPAPPEDRRLAFEGLCEPALALTLGRVVVGNDLRADGKDLILITGANQGGKSTFLRSVGLAQLMMQSGMFVTAEAFCASLVDGIATHFRREEAAGMDSGRLDDELARMSDIVDHVTPHMMIMLNESFAATNEREGSEIARQILSALLKRRLRMLTVTHFYDLAQSFAAASEGRVLFLRAERRDDGSRSFRVVEGGPLRTGYGEDLYREIFREAGQAPDDDADTAGDRGR